ncbi:hypothetical protein ACQ86N_35340 [Puia sp. P3]|uniref:hypothetical protein n=1 Tax=Puia sp. P3 TaxID=3423952 RepID=UPI003D67D57D
MPAKPQPNLIILVRATLGAVLSVLSLLFFNPAAQAQTITDPPASDLSQTGLLNDLSENTWYYFSPNKNVDVNQLPSLPYKKGTRKFDHYVSPAQSQQKGRTPVYTNEQQ